MKYLVAVALCIIVGVFAVLLHDSAGETRGRAAGYHDGYDVGRREGMDFVNAGRGCACEARNCSITLKRGGRIPMRCKVKQGDGEDTAITALRCSMDAVYQ